MRRWLLLLIPAADIAIALRATPARLGDSAPASVADSTSSNGVPDDARTMVVVPTLLTSVAGVAALLEHMEVLALRQSRPAHPFRDSERFRRCRRRASAEDDGAILAAARDGIQDLNGGSARSMRIDSFCFIASGVGIRASTSWMGWERKRGKIEEFNRLLRGATDTSFTVQVGELDVLPAVRYCITLDTDTRLPRDAAKIADRHHRPSAESAALRRRARIASPRATAFCSRA